MCSSGVIQNYALFGAAAQMRYTEPGATLDADVLVAVPRPDKLDVLDDIYSFCAARGYPREGEAIRVGSWPTQLYLSSLPSQKKRWIRPKPPISMGCRSASFRPFISPSLPSVSDGGKDFTRILSLLESDSVTRQEIGLLAARHGLSAAWQQFEAKFPNE